MHATLYVTMSVRRLVGWLVGRLVGWSVTHLFFFCLLFFAFFEHDVAVNIAIRKIFSFHRWESVRSFRAGLGYPDLYTIFANRRSAFTRRLLTINNHVLNLIGIHGLY